MRSLASWIVNLVSSPGGIVALAALDSTLLFSMPGGIDAAVLLLAARDHGSAWSVVLLATVGSLAGASLTFWMGVKIGEHGLEHYISARRLKRIRHRLSRAGAIGLAVLDLIPPPFPFTAFMLAAGALGVDASTFFGTLAACRLIRFGAEAALAVIYGPQLLQWLDSDAFRNTVIAVSVLALALTVMSIAKVFMSFRSTRRAAPAR